MKFKLTSEFKPTGDQPAAIAELVEGFQKGNQFQTLLGVTGSGKTFTVTNRILYLLEQGVPPESILVITFMKEAALSMQERDESLESFFVNLVGGGVLRTAGGKGGVHGFAFFLKNKAAL